MKRYLRLAAQLYPRAWRARYGKEFEALLDDAGASWRDLGDIFVEALKVHMRDSRSLAKFAAGMTAAGLVVGAALSFTGPKRYVSSAVVSIEADDGVDTAFGRAQTEVLSRGSLSEIVGKPGIDLYRQERSRVPMEDVVQDMRKDIQIRRLENGQVAVSYAYRDPAKAQIATQALVERLKHTMEYSSGQRASMWKELWPQDGDPPRVNAAILSPATLPDEGTASNLPRYVAIGGAMGLLAGLLVWRPKQNVRLAGYGLALAVVAYGFSWLLPDWYVSTGVIRVNSPQSPKRLWSELAPEPNDEYFRKLQAQILTPDGLMPLMRTLKIYQRDRGKLGDAAVAQRTLERDLQVRQVGQDAYAISFTYTDRYKTQLMVRELMTRFVERNLPYEPAAFRTVTPVTWVLQHSAGRNLEVLDAASLAEQAVWPNRAAILGIAFVVGVLGGLWRQRRSGARPPESALIDGAPRLPVSH